MYLVDTDVISEARKGDKGNPGVKAFFARVVHDEISVYLLSLIHISEPTRPY